MRIKTIKLLSIGAVLLALCIGYGCIGKKPTEPEPEPEPKEYMAYFADVENVNLDYMHYSYNISTDVIDSFYLPYDPNDYHYAISVDGKKMYLSGPENIIEVSLDSHVVIAEHPTTATGNELITSPDGLYLVLLRGELNIIKLSDFSVVYHDATASFIGNFTPDSRYFTCIQQTDSGFGLLTLDFHNNFENSLEFFESTKVMYAVINSTNSKVFAYQHIYGDIWRFFVYDRQTDSVIYQKTLCDGGSKIVITPDDKYVIFCQPPTMTSLCGGVDYFTIFDTEANEIYREVDAFNDSLQVVFPINELSISPDGRYLIGLGGRVRGQLFSYDMVKEEFVRQSLIKNNLSWFRFLSIQSGK